MTDKLTDEQREAIQQRVDKRTKELYSAPLGEWRCFSNDTWFCRVPSGWLFTTNRSQTFVPYSDEFYRPGANNA